MLSNHGGRQLDGVPATIDLLPGMASGGGRRGPAAARRRDPPWRRRGQGAGARRHGGRRRPPGDVGPGRRRAGRCRRVLEILRAELDHTLALCGADGTGTLTPSWWCGSRDAAIRTVARSGRGRGGGRAGRHATVLAAQAGGGAARRHLHHGQRRGGHPGAAAARRRGRTSCASTVTRPRTAVATARACRTCSGTGWLPAPKFTRSTWSRGRATTRPLARPGPSWPAAPRRSGPSWSPAARRRSWMSTPRDLTYRASCGT